MAKLHPYEDPARRCLKIHEWPEVDQRAWANILQPGDILDGTVGAGFLWSNATREKYRKGYGRWLTFLIRADLMDSGMSPSDRISSERVRAYMEELRQDVASWTLWGRVAELLAVASAFDPIDDWTWLRRIVRYLETVGRDSRNKFPYLRPAGEIAAWAYGRMDDIVADPPDRDPASHYRDALIIALLITCPTMRLGNLTMIRIGRHLRPTSEGYRLNFAASETKTDKPLSIPVPASLAAYLEYYIDTVRPILLDGTDTDRLWITRYGEPMKDKGVYNRITKVTERAFGKRINPHLFRDCAVTTVAIEDPEHIGIAAPILGHTDPRTTEKHYIQANAIAAGRRLRQSVDTLRKKHAPRHRREAGANL
jgi:integrase/recombinase XerD